jgi:Kef-type K+ transport system membrane component KefB
LDVKEKTRYSMNDFFSHLIDEFERPLQSPVLVFSLILFIILLSPIVLKRLNIPSIIGLIISGVLIGPHGLNVLEKNSAVELFSTIGLLYIMFIAGLELDMTQFKANRNRSLLFGLFTFAIPIAVGYPVCRYVLGYDFNASFLTASMFATHTLVAYPIVSKLGISKNQAVAITVGGTILTDTAVLIILAVIMGNSQGNLNSDFWLRMGISLSIFSFIMFFIIPRVAKWFFQKLESEKHSHYIFVLSVVFFAAFLAEVAGVEKIIGAFVAGLALNRLIPHSSALMNRIEFIGNSLFIPFFLISVGMIVDVSVILNGPTALIVAGTLSVVALFGKWLAAWFTQISFKYTKPQRQLIFGLSSSHAAATLAVILVGYNAKILDENILNGTIILILITCVVASFATEKAAKTIVLNEEENGESLPSSSELTEHILIPVANVETIEKHLEFALLVKDKKSSNPISILSVVPLDVDAELNIIKSRNKLDNYVKLASASEVKVNVISTIDHNVFSAVARISREIFADVLIFGWPKKSGFFEKLMGEKIDSIINNIDKNIFISSLEKPLVSCKRIVIVSPELCEKENGFNVWLDKASKLAQELSLPVVHFGNSKTQEAIEKSIHKKGLNISITFKTFQEWEDFLILSKEIQSDDLLIVISARKGSVSYNLELDNIPSKLERYFDNNNKIIVYPQQNSLINEDEIYSHINSEKLNKSIEAIGQFSKGIGSIFKRNK